MGIEQTKIERVVEEPKEEVFDFGFQAEYDENEGQYTTISGKEQKQVNTENGYGMADLEIGSIVTGYPEVTIFNNNDKDDEGDYVRNYQSARIRVIDEDEYVDLYANLPRRDDDGFIRNLNKSYNFMRTGFDLIFSFMRWINEYNVVDENGEEINKIKVVNIENICKKIDTMKYIKIKIVKGADEDYNSFIILDLQ